MPTNHTKMVVAGVRMRPTGVLPVDVYVFLFVSFRVISGPHFIE